MTFDGIDENIPLAKTMASRVEGNGRLALGGLVSMIFDGVDENIPLAKTLASRVGAAIAFAKSRQTTPRPFIVRRSCSCVVVVGQSCYCSGRSSLSVANCTCTVGLKRKAEFLRWGGDDLIESMSKALPTLW